VLSCQSYSSDEVRHHVKEVDDHYRRCHLDMQPMLLRRPHITTRFVSVHHFSNIWDWTGSIMLIILFLVSHFNFLFVPCGGLSWLPVSFLLHVKYTISYRIVGLVISSYRFQRDVRYVAFYDALSQTRSPSQRRRL